MTRKELYNLYLNCNHCRIGYGCYQDEGLTKSDLKEIGYNTGVYGWNWTAYLDCKTDTLYISNYRNVPSYIKRK